MLLNIFLNIKQYGRYKKKTLILLKRAPHPNLPFPRPSNGQRSKITLRRSSSIVRCFGLNLEFEHFIPDLKRRIFSKTSHSIFVRYRTFFFLVKYAFLWNTHNSNCHVTAISKYSLMGRRDRTQLTVHKVFESGNRSYLYFSESQTVGHNPLVGPESIFSGSFARSFLYRF